MKKRAVPHCERVTPTKHAQDGRGVCLHSATRWKKMRGVVEDQSDARNPKRQSEIISSERIKLDH